MKIKKLKEGLSNFFVEREDAAGAIVLALLSQQNMFLLGPPGTAKSMLIRTAAEAIEGARFFQYLLTKFTTPEEIFGPFSIKALENDEYRRITTGKLPEAEIAFLDEIFKASSSILNTLLHMINERIFVNDGKPTPVPLISLFGASNEIPQGEELKALYDRFLLRVMVNYIKDDAQFERLLLSSEEVPDIPRVSMKELKEAQQEASQVKIHKSLLEVIVEIRRKLKKEGIVLSDRRFVQALKVIKAQAYLEGRTEATEEDLQVLSYVAWDAPETILPAVKVINSVVNPLENEATEQLDMAKEIYEEAFKNQDANSAVEATSQLKEIAKKLEQILKRAEAEGRNTSGIAQALSAVKEMNKKIVTEILKIEI